MSRYDSGNVVPVDFQSTVQTLAESGSFPVLAEGSAPTPVALLASRDANAKTWGPRWLERAGFAPRIVTSGPEVIEAVSTLDPSVVIVEASLRDTRGRPILEALRDVSSQTVPTLVLCANAREVEQAIDAEAVDIVQSPVDWRIVSRRAALAARSFRSFRELDNARSALEAALAMADDARRSLVRNEEIDALTGLPNRRKFRELLERSLISRREGNGDLTVLVVGLDRFHLVNDALGHDHGNHVLAEVGARLRRCLSRREVIGAQPSGLLTAAVGKLAGVRFGLLIANVDAARDLLALRSGLVEALAEPFEVRGQSVYLSASVGAVVVSDADESPNRLLMNAEIAMLEAKRRGGGFHVMRELREGGSARKLELDGMLRESLERGELHLEYQPLVDAVNARVVGAEALLRWNHPEQGPIPPGEFIPVAEENGLMVRIGGFVIETACRQLRAWHDAGATDLRMAINLSLCQLLRGDVVATVRQALEANDLDPGCLELELSERGVMRRYPEVCDKLQRLRELGVRLSIDDFGAGDSAIAYLKDLPVDTVKIDRSYVSGALNDRRDKAIALAMVTLAQGLELTVIAEGVETREQLDLFRSWGCPEYQGFYCSGAVPADAFLELARVA